ncbi:MAG TPA: ferredoxin [Pseudonocardiaceae bacterium]|jgi:ferredoxin|nr:ferredoxin [Pseudonocardiaceae bacterium]
MSPRRILRIETSLEISVNNARCHLYGTCQAEAPELFELTEDERLRYVSHVSMAQVEQAKAAARGCPMRAVSLSVEWQ